MIVNRHVATAEPHNGLSPGVLNVPCQYVVNAMVAHTSGVASKTQQTAGSSIVAGTQIDTPRNVMVVMAPTQSSGGITGGGVTVYGRDMYDVARSETFGTGIKSHATGLTGSINFAKVDTISMKLSFHSDTSTAASAFSVYIGLGSKLGLPVSIRSSNAVFAVRHYTSQMITFSHSDSTTNNQWTVSTGDYWNNGLFVSGGVSSASLLQVGYVNLGFRPGAPSPVE